MPFEDDKLKYAEIMPFQAGSGYSLSVNDKKRGLSYVNHA